MNYTSAIIVTVFCLAFSAKVTAQDKWPSPEVQQMVQHAGENVARGNFNDAITTYRQAILLAPGKPILYKELGRAQYLYGDFAGADNSLSHLRAKTETDPETYQLLAKARVGEQKTREAKRTLQEGLQQYPASGLLYNELGRYYAGNSKPEDALNEWLTGIKSDSSYGMNYYDAAVTYLNSENVLWGLLYGEVYLNMVFEPDTNVALKHLIYTGYKKLFDKIAGNEILIKKKDRTAAKAQSFGDAVMQVYASVTPVVSDGISTENLVMARTRFAMEWFSDQGSKYPFCLFAYHDELLRNGKFEIYNEWLFGEAENKLQFEAWNKFHDGDITRFKAWHAAHKTLLEVPDRYNERNFKNMFGKKK